MSKEYGIVYLLTNPVMPGLVKIGMTAQEDIDKRMKELYTTGVPVPFECQYACKVDKNDCLKIENTYLVWLNSNLNRFSFDITTVIKAINYSFFQSLIRIGTL